MLGGTSAAEQEDPQGWSHGLCPTDLCVCKLHIRSRVLLLRRWCKLPSVDLAQALQRGGRLSRKARTPSPSS